MHRIVSFAPARPGATLIYGVTLVQNKVIYHIDSAQAQASKGLRNIRNHHDELPTHERRGHAVHAFRRSPHWAATDTRTPRPYQAPMPRTRGCQALKRAWPARCA